MTDERASPWRDGFLFVGNQLALDFINTRPVVDGEAVELLPDFGAVLRWFQAAGPLSPRDAAGLRRKWRDAAGKSALRRLREWRERLRSVVTAWEAGRAVPATAVDELNQLMAAHPVLARLAVRPAGLAVESWLRPQTPEGLFAPLAQSAATLFAAADRDRVRMCDNCVLHFLDTSKKGTRRWCSMELCGNRLKVAAYTARHRKGESREPSD
jgi:predicted RNA-binding Zn ribbon-like protein